MSQALSKNNPVEKLLRFLKLSVLSLSVIIFLNPNLQELTSKGNK